MAYPLPRRRHELLGQLWPEEESATAGNRLRVALSRLRKLVPIRESEDGIALASEDLDIDLWRVKHILEAAFDEPDEAIEWQTLVSVLPELGHQLLPDSVEEWLKPIQTEWLLLATSALERMLVMCEDRPNDELALEVAMAGIALLPSDERFWSAYLHLMARMGRISEAKREFRAKRAWLRENGEDFDPDLLDLVERLSSVAESGAMAMLPERQGEMMSRFFSNCLKEDPQLAVQVLGSSFFRREVIRDPRTAIGLLRQVADRNLPPSEALERVRVRIITAESLLYNDEAVVREARKFLADPVQPARRRIALLNLSFSLFLQGKKEEALQAIEESIVLAQETALEFDMWQCVGQKAILLLYYGQIAASIELFEGALAHFATSPYAAGDLDLPVIEGHYGYALLLSSQLEAAERALLSGYNAAVAHKLFESESTCGALLALCAAKLGDAVRARRLMRKALRLGFRHSRWRAVYVLGVAADLLDALGDERRDHVLDRWITARQELRYPMNAIEEQRLARRAFDARQAKSDHLVDHIRHAIEVLKIA